MRFAITRAVSGLSALAIHSARARRRPELPPEKGMTAGSDLPIRHWRNPGSTLSLLLARSPPESTKVSGSDGTWGGVTSDTEYATGRYRREASVTRRSLRRASVIAFRSSAV